jgi:hypothetical protein
MVAIPTDRKRHCTSQFRDHPVWEKYKLIDTRYSVLQPVVEDNRKIMMAQLLVDPFEKIFPVRLMNMYT